MPKRKRNPSTAAVSREPGVRASEIATTPAPAPTALPTWVWAGLLVTLAALLLHAWSFRFLTDDAFISFRYARHLADGIGLVFNDASERVEGYTNFLWVLVLAGFDRIGWRPESSANALSLAATAGLFAIVTGFALRHRPHRGAEWLVLLPGACLALFRSVAVWSTSGLETRFFELLVVGAAVRLIVEVEELESDRNPRLVSGWLWGLAALTRPEGALLAVCALTTAVVRLVVTRHVRAGRVVAWVAPFAAMLIAHLAFRRLYYGEWVPNTFFAKVGNRWWWSSGFEYLFGFALEYALPLWLAVAACGVMLAKRERRSFGGILVVVLMVPYLTYVAQLGGDHFEYRLLDLTLIFLALAVYEGARALATSRGRTLVLAALLAIATLLTGENERRSRQEYVSSFVVGFPGRWVSRSEQARRFLDPDRSPLYRWPLLRTIAAEHQRLIRSMTYRFVGIRQEEHRFFFATVEPEGRALGRLVADGTLPRDLYVAIACVGAIPYYSGLRTLDRVGLTDAHVAHGPSSGLGLMAHDKQASRSYAFERGVDLWAADGAHLIHDPAEPWLLQELLAGTFRDGVHAADLPDGRLLLCELPLGPESAARRMPRLRWTSVAAPDWQQSFLAHAGRALEDSVARVPGSADFALPLARIRMAQGDAPAACAIYTRVSQLHPGEPAGWLGMAECAHRANDRASERSALGRALEAANARGDSVLSAMLRRDLAAP